jgi:hypothetical protein
MLNLVVKSHNIQPLKLYKVGSNSSLETIRLESSQVQKVKYHFKFQIEYTNTFVIISAIISDVRQYSQMISPLSTTNLVK